MNGPSSTADTRRRVVNGSGEMFDAIAERYDLLNRIISLGRDQSWRRRTIDAIAPEPHHRVLDVATGTADLLLTGARRTHNTQFSGVDTSAQMIEIGRRKISRSRFRERVQLTLGDAQNLPFRDADFDAATMAFGIRNVPDRLLALRELARVVKPGGKVAILELSTPTRGVLAPFSRLYTRHLVPRIAALLSSAAEYDYLQTSIRDFPAPDVFADMMSASGLQVEKIRPMTFGVVVLFVARSTGPGKGSAQRAEAERSGSAEFTPAGHQRALP